MDSQTHGVRKIHFQEAKANRATIALIYYQSLSKLGPRKQYQT